MKYQVARGDSLPTERWDTWCRRCSQRHEGFRSVRRLDCVTYADMPYHLRNLPENHGRFTDICFWCDRHESYHVNRWCLDEARRFEP